MLKKKIIRKINDLYSAHIIHDERSCLPVSVFRGPMLVAIIMIDGSVSVNIRWGLNLRVHALFIERRSNCAHNCDDYFFISHYYLRNAVSQK